MVERFAREFAGIFLQNWQRRPTLPEEKRVWVAPALTTLRPLLVPLLVVLCSDDTKISRMSVCIKIGNSKMCEVKIHYASCKDNIFSHASSKAAIV